MSGSSPDAEAVTRSTGIGAFPLAARRASTRWVTASINAFEVGPRFDPPEDVASYPAGFEAVAPATEGRPQKYFGSLNAWPIRLEPTVVPFATMYEPFAWPGKTAWATAVTAAG